jgi:2'-5' RNA ligase
MRNYQVQGNLFVQESRLCEFLVILPVPQHIRQQVNVFKEEFEVLYGDFNSRHSIPHITICDFLLFEHRTYDTMTFFQDRLKSLEPLNLRVNGFDSFNSSKTLYAHVEKSEPFSNLLTQVDITRQMLRLRKNYFQSNTPHITIAKNLSSNVYQEAKEVFQKRDFYSDFEADRMEILKFDFITRRYRLFGTIPFAGPGS